MARATFLLGYPRSGTTLVATVLAGVPGTAVLEELPTLRAAADFLEPGGLARLLALPPGDVERLRASWWQVARRHGVGEARLVVDMDPFKGLQLPLIGRLFPEAPVVIMRRDPRDVVLSCFRQNFAASPAALEFRTLASTARHYAATMALIAACLPRLANPVLELRYEALVADFDCETRRLCDFLGLPWSPDLRDVAGLARRRDIGTASAGQLRRGLYDGSGQWRPFADELVPVLPVLAPWIDALGYDLNANGSVPASPDPGLPASAETFGPP